MSSLVSHYKRVRFVEFIKIVITWIGSLGILFYLLVFSIINSIILLFSGIIWGTLFIIQGINSSSSYPFLIALLIIVLSITWGWLGIFPYFRFWREYRKKYKEANNFTKLEKLPQKLEEIIKIRIDSLYKKMSAKHQKMLDTNTINFLYEKRNFTATPSMLYYAKNVNLIIPLGFFKVLRTDVESADAILAHELAHFLHKDSNLLFKIRCYYQVIGFWEVYVPFILINSIISTILLQYQRNPIFERMSIAIIVIGSILGVLFSVYLLRLYYRTINITVRNRVLKAEKMADLYAMTLTSPSALQRFLISYVNHQHHWYSLHPKLDDRLAQIKRCQKYTI